MAELICISNMEVSERKILQMATVDQPKASLSRRSWLPLANIRVLQQAQGGPSLDTPPAYSSPRLRGCQGKLDGPVFNGVGRLLSEPMESGGFHINLQKPVAPVNPPLCWF